MELKGKVRKVMLDHLTAKGYPELTTKQILSELKPMWLKLEEAGLIQKGWTYSTFARIASEQSRMQDMRDAMESELLKHFTGRKR